MPTAPEIAQVATSLRAQFEALPCAREFGESEGELQSEGGRFGVNAMRAADRRRELVLARASLKRGVKRINVGDEEVGRVHELNIKTGIQHVGGRHALMHKPRRRSDNLGKMGKKRDNVVLNFALDLFDPRGIEFRRFAFCPDCLGGILRDHPELGHGVGGVGLDLEPDAKPRFRRPDRRHLRTRIARDGHAASPRASAAALRIAAILAR